MELKIKSYSSQSALISSIIFFILGGIIFTFADEIASTIYLGIGIILAVIAVISLVMYGISVKKQEVELGNLATGIILLIVSGLFIFASGIIDQVIRFIIGFWVLFNGITRLINALSINKRSAKFLPLLIVSAVLIGIGIYTIMVGAAELKIAGIILMIYSAVDIVGYVFYTKDNQEKEEEGATSLIIPDKKEVSEKKKKKVKDVDESKEENENKEE